MLVIAAAANAEMRAARRDAFGRRIEDALHARADEFLFLLDGLGGNALGGQHEGDEDRRAVVMAKAFAAVDQLFDCDVHGV